MTPTQRRNQRKRARRAAETRKEETPEEGEDIDAEDEVPDVIGMLVRTRSNRPGVVIKFDPEDEMFQMKIKFLDDQMPEVDWLAGADVFTKEPGANKQFSEEDGMLYDIFEDEGIGRNMDCRK